MINFIEKIKNDEIINEIIKYSEESQLYLVGGCVRDYIMGKDNFDKDIIVKSTTPKEFSKNLAQKLNATFIELDSENKIYRLVLEDKKNYIDIAAMVGNSILEDLRRRDLTINAIAVNLKNFEAIDINNGINDLKYGIIKHISEKNITDDYLRVLRAYRFQSTLGFKIDDSLKALLKKHYKGLENCSIERINQELLKLFGGKYCDETLLDMDKIGLIDYLFPTMQEVKKIPSNTHHHLPLFLHLVETVKQIQLIYEKSSDEVKNHLDSEDFGGATRLAHLKLSGFLHDIGKPQTWTIEEDTGRHRFIKHDDLGSKMSIEILRNNKFSKKQIKYISLMIKNHIYPSQVISAPELNNKVFMRFVRKMENDSIDVIILAQADRLSAQGKAVTKEMTETNINNLNKLLAFYISVKDTLKPLPKLIDGTEIMKLLDIPASEKLGEIIERLKEAQISGDVLTKEDAINFVKAIK